MPRQVGFEDLIAEPLSTHSFDRVWIGSHAVFELSKYVFYRVLTTLLAVPMAFLLGLVFGVLSCIHVWYGCVSALHRVIVLTALGAMPSVQLLFVLVLLAPAYLTPETLEKCYYCFPLDYDVTGAHRFYSKPLHMTLSMHCSFY